MAYVLKNTGSPAAQKLDMIAYGLPGTQKTYSISYFQQMGFNPFVVACDPGGVTTLKDSNIQYAEISSQGDVKHLIGDIKKGIIDIRQHGMICIDGGSNLSYLCLKATGENANDRRLDYTNYWIEFRKIIDEFRRLPLHFYLNCHAAELKADNNRWGAQIEGGRYSINFTGLFNTVVCMRRMQDGTKDQFGNPAAPVYVQTYDDGNYNCRDRTNSCNPFEPNLGVVVQKILTARQ